MSTLGHVASGHPLATAAGHRMLRAGGNAFDAAVAGGFAQTIVEPLLCSLGGGGCMVTKASSGEHKFFDFFVDFPGLGKGLNPKAKEIEVDFLGTTQNFKIGEGSITAPGVLEGLIYTHKKLGKLPLKKILEPAIEYARDGHEINRSQGEAIYILREICAYSEEGRELYFNGRVRKKEGEIYKNVETANLLEQIGDGLHQGFRDGELIQRICDDVKDFTTLNVRDFDEYRVIEREPFEWSYRGCKIFTNPEPALGGVFMGHLLSALEEYKLEDMQWGSPEHIVALATVLKKVEDFKEANEFKKGTTHLSASDQEGNLASLTLSNGEGSGYFAPGTGIMLSNMVGEEDIVGKDFSRWTPGERMPSMMSPVIVETPEGKVIALGTGGSKRIRSSLFTVISHLVDFKLHLKEAIMAPRMNWDGSALQIEPGFSKEVIHALEEHFPVNEWDHLAFFYGGIHSVIHNEEAFGDPRRMGEGR